MSDKDCEKQLWVLRSLVLEIREAKRNLTRCNVHLACTINEAASYADGNYSSGNTRHLEATFDRNFRK